MGRLLAALPALRPKAPAVGGKGRLEGPGALIPPDLSAGEVEGFPLHVLAPTCQVSCNPEERFR